MWATGWSPGRRWPRWTPSTWTSASPHSTLRWRAGKATAQRRRPSWPTHRPNGALADANLKRNQDLARQNFISAGALEARTQETASASAGLQSAQANLDATAQDLNRLRAERAALAQQRDSLKLVAPAAAIVSSRDAEAGSTVVAGQAVVKLIDPASLWVKLRVDQGRSAGLAPGSDGAHHAALTPGRNV